MPPLAEAADPTSLRPHRGGASSAARETRWAARLACLALVWTVAASYGLDEPDGATTFVFGFPRWFFWGVVVPWGTSYLLSLVFCFCVMQDEPLGDPDAEEAAADAPAAPKDGREAGRA